MSERKTVLTKRKIGLALGGGGSRGFAHLGVAKALRELKVPIYCVAGTSIGSIVGGVIASDMLQRALNWACDPDWFKLPMLFLKFHLPWRSIVGSERIEMFFKDMICAKTFDELIMPFAAVATDLYNGRTVVMTEGDVQTAIRASMAIPGVFDPVLRNGRVLVDGGLTNPVPVDVCRLMGAEKVIAVNINATSLDRVPPVFSKLNMLTIIDQTFTVVCERVARETFERVRPECILNPPVGDVMMLDFRNARRLIDVGYACVMAHQEEINRLVYSSLELTA